MGTRHRIIAAAFVPPALQCPMRFMSGRSATRTRPGERPRKAKCCAAASYLSLIRPAKAPHLRQYCCAESAQLGTKVGLCRGRHINMKSSAKARAGRAPYLAPVLAAVLAAAIVALSGVALSGVALSGPAHADDAGVNALGGKTTGNATASPV